MMAVDISTTKSYPNNSKYLELIMKIYPQSSNGITRQLIDGDDNQHFTIDGPFGIGLNLTPKNIKGKTVIFLGGTGILPFIDFFAYLYRLLIKERDPMKNLFYDEEFEEHFKQAHFTVYAYYPNRSEAVGYELCSNISEFYFQNRVEERFKFIPTFTQEGGNRLSKQEIIEILKKHHSEIESELKNVWVCGPPSMNNMFQRIKKDLTRDLNLNEIAIY